MKFCPMCGMSQPSARSTACAFCDYEEKPFDSLSKRKICEFLAPYEYERVEDGVRINAVKNGRDLSLRGAVSVPHFVTEIAAGAFAHCKFLARIDLPRGLRAIGEGAFAHCRDLFDVFIPAHVTYVGKGAFSDCYDLSVICAEAPAQPDTWDSEWLADCDATVTWASAEED